MPKAQIIGIYSSFPGQGAELAADRLIKKFGYRKLKFRRIANKMLLYFLVEIGYPEQQALEIIEKKPDLPLERVAGMPTARWLSNTLFYEWGEHSVSNLVWNSDWELKARVWSGVGVGIVADDLETPGQVETIRALGGSIWRVTDPRVSMPRIPGASAALSTCGRLEHVPFDRTLVNEGTVGQFNKQVDKAESRYMGPRGPRGPRVKKEKKTEVTGD